MLTRRLSGLATASIFSVLLSIFPIAKADSQDLMLYFAFNEGAGTTAADSSGNNNNGTLINNAKWATGKYGMGLDLDGINSYVLVPNSESLKIAGPFTTIAWIYPRSWGTFYKSFINKYHNYMFQTGDSSTNPGRLRITFTDHYLETSDNTLSLNTWQHVAAVWDGNYFKLYKDGVLVASSNEGAVTPPTEDNPLYIGAEWGTWEFFDGLMDEVKIYRRALSAQEILAEALNNASGLAMNLKFDEGAGTTAADSSGNNNNGTLINNAKWATGKYGMGLDLDGINSYVLVPNSESLKIAGPFTTIAWIYPRDWGTFYRSFINKYHNYMFQTGNSGTNPGRLRITFTDHYLESSDNTLSLNTWQHVAAVWDGNYFKLYKDGVLVASSNEGAVTPPTEDNPLYVGAEWGTWEFFNGLMDEVKVYRRALSQTELRIDCGTCYVCGDGVCSYLEGETCADCSLDCGSCEGGSACGDGYCNSNETATTCPEDCSTSGRSCPYVHLWNGKEYVRDNDILPAGNPKIYIDHYKLMKPLVAKDDKYFLKIVDSEDETSWIDMIKLLQIDHAGDVKVAPSPTGEIMTYKSPVVPIEALDKNKATQISKVSSISADPNDSYYGEAGDYLILNFGKVQNRENGARIIMRTDLKCPYDWYLPKKTAMSLHVSILNKKSKWKEIGVVHPHQKWDEWAVAIPDSYLKEISGDLKVKVEWTQPHKLDFIGLDNSARSPVVVSELPLVKAVHSKNGNVLDLLVSADKKNAITVMGDEISLEFPALSQPTGQRSFVFVSKGKYRANVTK